MMKTFKQYLTEFKSWFTGIVPLPFQEGPPSKEKVIKIKEWLDIHSDLYKNEYTVMYHGTDANLPIEKEGLKPTSFNRRKSYQSSSGYVYLAVTPERAKMYGDIANQSNSKVYECRVLIRKLLPDIDNLRNYNDANNENLKYTLANSIVYSGSVRVKGKISNTEVKEYQW